MAPAWRCASGAVGRAFVAIAAPLAPVGAPVIGEIAVRKESVGVGLKDGSGKSQHSTESSRL
jgi:hypothetical protein